MKRGVIDGRCCCVACSKKYACLHLRVARLHLHSVVNTFSMLYTTIRHAQNAVASGCDL